MSQTKGKPHVARAARAARKPIGYWNDFANVEREIRAFIRDNGVEDVMPTYTEMTDAGRVNLAHAIRRHGGFPIVAERLSLKRPNSGKPAGYWIDFTNVERELLSFLTEHGMDGIMPTVEELSNARRSDLASAISKHGGFPIVAERLGLIIFPARH